ncbi:hypothetical protein [Pseudoalteromonas ruthenica]|uniref:hypothetical protein n=1 Tax=Pseudoalteromonas ruthenica TaxID=151081 RepID=UPI001486EA6F|nr:hypothetical protein [Pseudoalteromonas ruthenica]|tara:strand:+ start:494 stop:655 length:162 start_codon:yes stop_codon:yes gene_type:complete
MACSLLPVNIKGDNGQALILDAKKESYLETIAHTVSVTDNAEVSEKGNCQACG